MKYVQCPLHNMSIFKFGKTINFHIILFLRCLNYLYQLPFTKNSPGNVKESVLKHEIPVFKRDKQQDRNTENPKAKFDKKLY